VEPVQLHINDASIFLVAPDNSRSPCKVQLPRHPRHGEAYIVKDARWSAGRYPITIQGMHPIDGQDRYIIEVDRGAVKLVFLTTTINNEAIGQWHTT
jgi:hypothetical protein